MGTSSTALQKQPANPPPHHPPATEGCLERGRATTASADERQPGCQFTPTPTPPPPAKVRARVDRARGDRSGLTAQQQRALATPFTIFPQARHAFSLYCECVAVFQWERLTIEQQPEGKSFSVSSRPWAQWAAAPAAARAASSKEKKARRRR